MVEIKDYEPQTRLDRLLDAYADLYKKSLNPFCARCWWHRGVLAHLVIGLVVGGILF